MEALKLPGPSGGATKSKRVTIVRFNEPKSSTATANNQSSTHLMPPSHLPPPTSNLKKVSITSSMFSEDLAGYLDSNTFTTDTDTAEHVRTCFHHHYLHHHYHHQTHYS